MFGELIPVGGGDSIPLLKPLLKIGRRESADIVLRFPNVSGIHCELTLIDGFWTVTDLRSSNGTKVNGTRITEQRLQPGDKLGVGRHVFEIAYEPSRLGATDLFTEQSPDGVFGSSLLSKAGLEHRPSGATDSPQRSRRQSI